MSGWLQLSLLLSGLAETEGSHGGHDAGLNWFELAAMVGNFAILVGFLAYQLGPKISSGIRDRRASFEARLEEAQEKQKEAEARLTAYREKLQNLEREFQQVVESYEKQAQADKERLQEETDRAIDRLARETEFSIQQEVRKAEQAIRSAVLEQTLSLAEKKVTDRLTEPDRKRLTESYIRSLEQTS